MDPFAGNYYLPILHERFQNFITGVGASVCERATAKMSEVIAQTVDEVLKEKAPQFFGEFCADLRFGPSGQLPRIPPQVMPFVPPMLPPAALMFSGQGGQGQGHPSPPRLARDLIVSSSSSPLGLILESGEQGRDSRTYQNVAPQQPQDSNELPIKEEVFENLPTDNVSTLASQNDINSHNQTLTATAPVAATEPIKEEPVDRLEVQSHQGQSLAIASTSQATVDFPRPPRPNSRDFESPFEDEDIIVLDDDEDCDCSECRQAAAASVAASSSPDVQFVDEISLPKRPRNSSLFDELCRTPTKAPPSFDPPSPQSKSLHVARRQREVKRFRNLLQNCPITGCGAAFHGKFRLDEHLRLVHRVFQYRCMYENCGESFVNTIEFAQHQNTCHRNTPPICSQCSKGPRFYKDHGSLYMHILTYHYTGRFACAHILEPKVPEPIYCPFEATTRQEVIKHYYHAHKPGPNSQTGPLHCPETGCSNIFDRKSHLDAHRRKVHQPERPYRCTWPGCTVYPKGCADRSTLKRHIRGVHFGEQVRTKSGKKAGGGPGGPKSGGGRDPNRFIEVRRELL